MSLRLAVALDGAGWHPAAWRLPDARPADLFTVGYWADLVAEAERADLDFVTVEDALGVQSARFHLPDDRTDQVRGRLDAVLLCARVAPLTSRIGLVPTTNVTHTEPFHIAMGIATLDYVSNGRAGWRPQVASRAADAAHFGRRTTPQLTDADLTGPEAIAAALEDLHAEAGEAVEATRRLWDSWEDDAEIRDAATERFFDRNKVHHIDFRGKHFSVRGPAITPRPPQGQPLITVLAHACAPFRLAAGGADVVYVTPHSAADVTRVLGEVESAKTAVGRPADHPLLVFGELVVFLDREPGAAAGRAQRLDELDGAPLTSDAEIFTGTPAELADLLLDRRASGLDGFRLRPGALPHDLTLITEELVPELRRRGAFAPDREADTLRGRLGLTRPLSRYAAVVQSL
ncbi:LLM class flavin-dependent oxidoreductase [Nocardia bovistercoris]|uniref:LLM class flavin-dependent oxidoreductase n=1 Tax=Nocardia bovistercoris TaxID=2785916 RepID=A0A931N636_9NOCA|nr:LLM class flavin-dependent oxidoreductase [Nocardia bovistercoris]MBH0779288.1 LLM class flavin-dependent oxidoreductase [Nocardia bovistercoris]